MNPGCVTSYNINDVRSFNRGHVTIPLHGGLSRREMGPSRPIVKSLAIFVIR